MNIEIKLLDPRAKVPQYATIGSAAFDLCALDDFEIGSFSKKLIRTGIAISISDGFVGILASRSGHALKNDIRLGNGIGVIDSDYQQEVGVILRNDSTVPYIGIAGERIAQLMIVPFSQAQLMVVDEFTNVTDRGGFGSTGK